MKFPGDIWTVEIWTVKSGLGLPLGLRFLLRLDLGLGLVLGFELVRRLGLGLVMTVQILTVQIKTGNLLEQNVWRLRVERVFFTSWTLSVSCNGEHQRTVSNH